MSLRKVIPGKNNNEGRNKIMKKLWVVPFLLMGFLLTGCSVSLDHFTSDTESKAEKFASKAEAMGNQFDDTLAFLKQVEIKDRLTVQDQQRIVTEVNDLSVVIDAFIDEEAPLFQGAKDFAVDKLKERRRNTSRNSRKGKEW